MRFAAALLALAAVLLTAVVPCHRCLPAGSDGHGAVVLVGSHAHDGHGERCGCPHDHETAPDCGDERHPDGGPCCIDAPGDLAVAPTRADADAPASLPVVSTVVERAVPLMGVLGAVDVSGWEAPVPRAPTETVVLLR